MAELYGPFDGQAMYQSGWQHLGRALGAGGGDGIKEGGAVTLGSGRSVNLPVTLAQVGGFGYYNNANYVLTSSANVNANPVIDRLVLGMSWGLKKVTAYIKRGTAAGSPVPPALVQNLGGTWEIPVAYWTVPGSSGGTILNLVNDGPVKRMLFSALQQTASTDSVVPVAVATSPAITLAPGNRLIGVTASGLGSAAGGTALARAWLDGVDIGNRYMIQGTVTSNNDAGRLTGSASAYVVASGTLSPIVFWILRPGGAGTFNVGQGCLQIVDLGPA